MTAPDAGTPRPMGTVWKILAGLAVMLPPGAYVAGVLVGPPPQASPHREPAATVARRHPTPARFISTPPPSHRAAELGDGPGPTPRTVESTHSAGPHPLRRDKHRHTRDDRGGAHPRGSHQDRGHKETAGPTWLRTGPRGPGTGREKHGVTDTGRPNPGVSAPGGSVAAPAPEGSPTSSAPVAGDGVGSSTDDDTTAGSSVGVDSQPSPTSSPTQ